MSGTTSGIPGWVEGEHTADGVTHTTYRKGSGPGVVVISEIPGITDKVVAFAEESSASAAPSCCRTSSAPCPRRTHR